jgi:hypothetical protein
LTCDRRASLIWMRCSGSTATLGPTSTGRKQQMRDIAQAEEMLKELIRG